MKRKIQLFLGIMFCVASFLSLLFISKSPITVYAHDTDQNIFNGENKFASK